MNSDNRLSKIKLTIGTDVRDPERTKVYGEIMDHADNILVYVYKASDGEILAEIDPHIATAPIVVANLLRLLGRASKEVTEKSD